MNIYIHFYNTVSVLTNLTNASRYQIDSALFPPRRMTYEAVHRKLLHVILLFQSSDKATSTHDQPYPEMHAMLALAFVCCALKTYAATVRYLSFAPALSASREHTHTFILHICLHCLPLMFTFIRVSAFVAMRQHHRAPG